MVKAHEKITDAAEDFFCRRYLAERRRGGEAGS